ncbi:MBL fold metallo-hydrolase [Reichenbachiella sp. 5M10]|uniref:MBL fold metallo-hydrolase n=1 Tax=Reichenbachiella sp. 5M10 TaxID=1889772 RepID=UPI000C160129|nr:MBL fold metallo-hydrolase [Reichenbachiella sp. 5M10]PIB37344.1 MBL fold metallo-hydrolase [Reichenbachiella sp. 5M10]
MKNQTTILWAIFMCCGLGLKAQGQVIRLTTETTEVTVTPIRHATMQITYGEVVMVTDPHDMEGVDDLQAPTLVLITDIHGDHLDIEALRALGAQGTTIVAPQAVADKLSAEFGQVIVLANGDTQLVQGVAIEAVPMYNLPEDESSRHPKGRGNGYVLTMGGKRIYISGDTEDIEEMRALSSIDLAFVCMNLPYTMDVDAAADAVLAFKPKVVVPYHYRGKGGLSDVDRFKSIVGAGSDQVEVVLLNWYP